MQRDVKQNCDYRDLHTSGQKVVKPDDMSDIDRLKQHFLDSIDEVEYCIEDHKIQELYHIDEANECLQEANNIVEKYKGLQSELKIDLGEKFEGVHDDREAFTTKFRGYLRGLSARSRELKKQDRQKASEASFGPRKA